MRSPYLEILLIGSLFLCACGPSEGPADDDDVSDPPEVPAEVTVERVGGPIALHPESDGRGLFADVMLAGDRVFATFQLDANGQFCNGKNLYVREFDRQLRPVAGPDVMIDVSEVGTIFRPSADVSGDLGDHKLQIYDDHVYMVTTVPGEGSARLLRFGLDFDVQGQLRDSASLAQVGDMSNGDRLLDMGFGAGDGKLYVQFFNQEDGAPPEEWSAAIFAIDATTLEVGSQALVRPEENTFVTGTSIVWVPAGEMGMAGATLQSFSPNLDYGNLNRANIHTFSVDPTDLTLVVGSTRTITDAPLDVYFPTGADWNEEHQLWVVGYTQEIAEGLHGSVVPNAHACDGTPQPPDEGLREVGPSFISVYDAEWNELSTHALNSGEPAFRVMLETQGDDIYVAYDEMDLYAWQQRSIAKLEQFTIAAGR